jgi:hypothetical protein
VLDRSSTREHHGENNFDDHGERHWKHDGLRDLGLAAEEVALVEPMLTFKNKEGEIEGVKYTRVNLVLIDAVKEQQQQIAALQTRLRRLEQTLKNRPSLSLTHQSYRPR